MDIYIDCEWNSFGGDLISMALCAHKGPADFYEVLKCDNPHPWVAEHVIPVLNKESISFEEFQEKLEKYLIQFSSVNIVSDWPEDIERFCAALITGQGSRLNTPPLSMTIMRIDADSSIPHNALEDARGIRRACLTII
tara:strand:+ start:58 stop:471 length:414 start_codon:yes stop_codon:yes gene_type:complete